jgi:hypothetical protein
VTITRAQVEDMNDPDLIELARAVKAQRDEAGADFKVVAGELELRMERAGATLLEGDGANAELVTTNSYKWHPSVLWTDVRPQMTPATWGECVTELGHPALRPNTVRLEALRKKLGPENRLSRLIELARGVDTTHRLVIKETERE